MAAGTANGTATQPHEHTNGVTANGRAPERASTHSRAASGHNTLEELAAMQEVALQRHQRQLRSDPELAAAALDASAEAELDETFERGGSCNEMLQTICRVYAKRRAFGYSPDGSANFNYITYEEFNQRVLRLAAGVFLSCCLQSGWHVADVKVFANPDRGHQGAACAEQSDLCTSPCALNIAPCSCRVDCAQRVGGSRLLWHLRLCQCRLDQLRAGVPVPGCGTSLYEPAAAWMPAPRSCACGAPAIMCHQAAMRPFSEAAASCGCTRWHGLSARAASNAICRCSMCSCSDCSCWV